MAADYPQILSVPMMSSRIVRVQFNRLPKLSFRFRPVSVEPIKHERKGCMWFSQSRIKLDSLQRRFLRLCETLRRALAVVTKKCVSIGQSGVRLCEERIQTQRQIKMFDRLPQSLSCSLVPEESAFEILVVCLDTHRRMSR